MNINKNLIIFIGLLTIIAILLVVWSLQPKPIQVVSVEPKPNATQVGLDTPVKVKFNQKVDPDQVFYKIDPAALVQKKAQGAQTILLTPESQWQGSHIYQVSVWYQNQTSFAWQFTTKKALFVPFIPSSPVSSPTSFPPSPSLPSPTPEKEPKAEEIKDKIIDSLPYETESSSIQYLSDTDKFFILIKKNPYEAYKTQVLAWFKEFGIEDPEKKLPLFFTSTRWVAPE